MMANERYSGVDVVHVCFSKRDDSILGITFWELKAARQLTSFSD